MPLNSAIKHTPSISSILSTSVYTFLYDDACTEVCGLPGVLVDDLHGSAQQVMHSLKLRSMALAFPDKPIVPWPSYKSFSSRQ